MPVKAIKHVNKGNIVFQSDVNYEQLYVSILRILGPDAPFAPLTIQGAMLLWTPVKPGVYKSLADAPDEVLVLWEQMRMDLKKRLAVQSMEYVLDIPDLSYVFYEEKLPVDDGVLRNKYNLLITGWACKYGNDPNDGDDGLRNRMFEAQKRHQNVIVKMQNHDKQPLCNADFVYVFENAVGKEIKTDSVGCYEQGICVVGAKLTYTYKLTGQSQSLKVLKNVEVYPLTFASTTDIYIQVIDQYGNPVQAHPVRVEYGSETFDVETDGLGKVELRQVLYFDSSSQMRIEVTDLGQETFDVECPQCNVTMRVNVPEKKNYYLRVIDEHGAVSAGHSMKLRGAVDGIYATDDNGIIPLGELNEGDKLDAESTARPEAGIQNFVIDEGQEEYVYQLPEKKPVEDLEGCYVKVIRRADKMIIPNYSLKFESDTMNGLRLTDANGIVPLENIHDGMSLSVYGKREEPYVFKISAAQKEYVIEVDEEVPHEEMTVKCHIKVVRGEDSAPVPDYYLRIESRTVNEQFRTDEAGVVLLGSMEVGTTMLVRVPDFAKPVEFLIEKEKEEYLIRLEEKETVRDMPCYIRVVRGKDMVPVENYSLHIDSETMKGNFKTDNYGILPMQHMQPGEQVECIVDSNADKKVSFVIEEGKDEYLIQLEDKPDVAIGDIMITLLDKDKETPVTPATITLKNKANQKFIQQNDSTGSIVVPRTFFKDGQKFLFHAEKVDHKIRDCKIRYVDTCDHYIVYLKEPVNWKRLLWLLLLPAILLLSLVQCKRDITVQTVDVNGAVIGGAEVRMEYKEHALYKEGRCFYNKDLLFRGVTDNAGYYTFEKVPCSIYSYIFYSFQSAYAAGNWKEIVKGKTEFVFHWRKDVEIVLYGRKIIQVKCAETDRPIPDASVYVKGNDVEVDTVMSTNENGLCALSLGAYTHVKPDKFQITATKEGYSGVQTNYDLYENVDQPLILYLNKPEPCRDQAADNNDRSQGNMAMKDYDMGVSQGVFLFEYYTDTAPDEIFIYDGSSSDLMNGTAACIFHYSGATDTQDYSHSENVSFSSRYICVVVKGGTNWGYIVRCPEP